uniref:Uncharacterized protein n=1 Tax=Solibacter usitatus (strain Ellin6076) TaxID=234267 RepID=Q027D5_SOLUE
MLRALAIFGAGFLLQAPPSANGQAFDVASVKLLGADERKVPLFAGGPDSSDPGRLHLRVNMSLLLGAAFGVSVDQIKGPAWLRDFSAMPFYDIVATMPANSSKRQVEKMLQNLLVERFHLVFHHETGSFPGYELVVDKGGPKLKEITPDSLPAADPPVVRGAPTGSDGFPIVRGRRTSSSRSGTVNQRIKDQEWTMADLARQLGFLIGRSEGKSLDDGFFQPRVIDKTGLTGKYTFILEFDCPACVTPAPALPANPDGATAGNGMDDSLGFPNIFAAVQKELGLRLIRIADVEMDVIVLDALNRIPIEN